MRTRPVNPKVLAILERNGGAPGNPYSIGGGDPLSVINSIPKGYQRNIDANPRGLPDNVNYSGQGKYNALAFDMSQNNTQKNTFTKGGDFNYDWGPGSGGGVQRPPPSIESRGIAPYNQRMNRLEQAQNPVYGTRISPQAFAPFQPPVQEQAFIQPEQQEFMPPPPMAPDAPPEQIQPQQFQPQEGLRIRRARLRNPYA